MQSASMKKTETAIDDDNMDETIQKMKVLQEWIETLPPAERAEMLKKMNEQISGEIRQETIAWLGNTMISFATARIENPDKSVFAWIRSLEKDDKNRLRICLESGGTRWRELEWLRHWMLKEFFNVSSVSDDVIKKIEAMRIQDAREACAAYMLQGMFINMFRTTGGTDEGMKLVQEKVDSMRAQQQLKKPKDPMERLSDQLTVCAKAYCEKLESEKEENETITQCIKALEI